MCLEIVHLNVGFRLKLSSTIKEWHYRDKEHGLRGVEEDPLDILGALLKGALRGLLGHRVDAHRRGPGIRGNGREIRALGVPHELADLLGRKRCARGER